MKKTTFAEKGKGSRYKGFYAAISISILMIGAACAYAYRVTTESNETMEEELSQIAEMTQPTTNFMAQSYDTYEPDESEYNAVAGVKTDVLKETTIVQTTTVEVVAEVQEAPAEAPAAEAEETISHVLVMPVEGEIAQPFSNGELVKSETTGTWQTHNGVDILAETGTPVHVMDNGTVVEVVNDPLWGISVTVDHENGILSRYCNLSPSLELKEGETVESGQTLGVVGDTADMESKMEPHLHFEVIKGSEYIDPYEYVTNG